MPYHLPLHIEESWTGFKLVDADGLVIASAAAYPWHGVPTDKQPDFVLENFKMLADAANKPR